MKIFKFPSPNKQFKISFYEGRTFINPNNIQYQINYQKIKNKYIVNINFIKHNKRISLSEKTYKSLSIDEIFKLENNNEI